MRNQRLIIAAVACALILACDLNSGPLAQRSRPRSKITADAARRIALGKYPGRVIGHVKLEREDGLWQYSVVIRSHHKMREVMVDSHSGRITNVEITTEGEERREAAEDAKKGGNHK